MAEHLHLGELGEVLEIFAAELGGQRLGAAFAIAERRERVAPPSARAPLEQHRLVERHAPARLVATHVRSASTRRSTSSAE